MKKTNNRIMPEMEAMKTLADNFVTEQEWNLRKQIALAKGDVTQLKQAGFSDAEIITILADRGRDNG